MQFVFRRHYRGPLRAVIFDWSGTTVDFGCMAPAVVFRALFAAHGVEVTMAECREPMGAHKRAHIQEMLGMDGVRTRWEAARGAPPTEADVDALFADFTPRQAAVVRDFADLIPGTAEAVNALREQGLRIGSTSGYPREIMDVLLEEGARRGYRPDCIVAASEVPAGRPAPWMAFECMKQLGVYPAEACIKVGDTPKDIQEGLNAGMWSIGVAVSGNEVGLDEAAWAATSDTHRQRLRERAVARLAQAGAHYVVDSAAHVPALIDDIRERVAAGDKP